MTGYTFLLCCPLCAGSVDARREGVTSGWQTRATASCLECRADLVVQVQVVVDTRERRLTPARSAQLGRARAAKLVHA